MSPRAEDPRRTEGVAAIVGSRSDSVLAVPCGTDDAVHGVMELVGKHGGGPFSFDDVEIVTLLGTVAGAALGAETAPDLNPPSPEELAGKLARLATADPARYSTIAIFLASTLADD
jgi:hypothetical protein